jgi:hypothetical protein
LLIKKRGTTAFARVVGGNSKATETANGGIVTATAISITAFIRRKFQMSKERFNRETTYRAAITAALEMLSSGVISDKDFSEVKAFFVKKYRPFFA